MTFRFYLGNDCMYPDYTEQISFHELKGLVATGMNHMCRSDAPPRGCVPQDPDKMVPDKSYYIYGVSRNYRCCLLYACKTLRDHDFSKSYLMAGFPFVRSSFPSMRFWYRGNKPSHRKPLYLEDPTPIESRDFPPPKEIWLSAFCSSLRREDVSDLGYLDLARSIDDIDG
ncbi:MAG: hypothetical protein ACYCOU_02695 [Sulfobacillus sp.]